MRMCCNALLIKELIISLLMEWPLQYVYRVRNKPHLGELNQMDILRNCTFRPYRKGMGPSFRLTLWDTHKTDSMGKSRLGYRLTQHKGKVKTELFTGEDFCCSPLHCVDSDETVAAIMSFLTLRRGDTDSEFFENYTPTQTEFTEQHAEALACEVLNRFGE